MTELQVPSGQEIENESFRIIRAEIGQHDFNEKQFPVVVRVVHATADFDFVDNLRFHPQAIPSAVAALRRGADVITDVHMVEVGISSRLLTQLGGHSHCKIRDPQVRALAQASDTTRAVAAMRYMKERLNGNLVAIGNAPTALFEVLRLIEGEGVQPALVVGVPVGFVNTVESKQALAELDVPFITALGRKGGSTVAAAIVNALLRLAAEQV